MLPRVPVPAGRVGLPDLDQRVRHRTAAGVAHLAEDDDPLPLWLPRVLRGEVGVLYRDQVVAEQRPGHLGEPVRQQNERLLRVPQRGRLVAGEVERRVIARLRAHVGRQGELPVGPGNGEALFGHGHCDSLLTRSVTSP